MEDSNKQAAVEAYMNAQLDAQAELKVIQDNITGTPNGLDNINWANVGDMKRITKLLSEIADIVRTR